MRLFGGDGGSDAVEFGGDEDEGDRRLGRNPFTHVAKTFKSVFPESQMLWVGTECVCGRWMWLGRLLY